jgi:hypothetical protein
MLLKPGNENVLLVVTPLLSYNFLLLYVAAVAICAEAPLSVWPCLDDGSWKILLFCVKEGINVAAP